MLCTEVVIKKFIHFVQTVKPFCLVCFYELHTAYKEGSRCGCIDTHTHPHTHTKKANREKNVEKGKGKHQN